MLLVQNIFGYNKLTIEVKINCDFVWGTVSLMWKKLIEYKFEFAIFTKGYIFKIVVFLFFIFLQKRCIFHHISIFSLKLFLFLFRISFIKSIAQNRIKPPSLPLSNWYKYTEPREQK